MTDRKVLGTFVARREQQLQGDDPILQAASEVAQLYGRLSMRFTAEQVLVAVFLAQRSLFLVLRSAVGMEHASDIIKRAEYRALNEYRLNDECVPDITVFDKDRRDEE